MPINQWSPSKCLYHGLPRYLSAQSKPTCFSGSAPSTSRSLAGEPGAELPPASADFFRPRCGCRWRLGLANVLIRGWRISTADLFPYSFTSNFYGRPLPILLYILGPVTCNLQHSQPSPGLQGMFELISSFHVNESNLKLYMHWKAHLCSMWMQCKRETSAPIRALECNFRPFGKWWQIDQQTDRPTDGQTGS